MTAANQDFTVPPGSTPTPVELTAGATGGPFDDAQIVAVEPSNAGTVRLGGASVAGISFELSDRHLPLFHAEPATPRP